MGGVSAPGEPSSLPHMRCPDTGRSSPAHRLLHRGGPVGGRIPQSLAHLQGAPHLRVEAGTLQGRLPLLVLQGDIRVPGQEEAAQGARRRTLSPSVQDSTTRCTQHAHPVQTGPAACSQTAQPSARRLQPPRRHSLLPTSTVLHGKSTETRDGIRLFSAFPLKAPSDERTATSLGHKLSTWQAMVLPGRIRQCARAQRPQGPHPKGHRPRGRGTPCPKPPCGEDGAARP